MLQNYKWIAVITACHATSEIYRATKVKCQREIMLTIFAITIESHAISRSTACIVKTLYAKSLMHHSDHHLCASLNAIH